LRMISNAIQPQNQIENNINKGGGG
jgi:hypothetical protein